MNSHYIEKCEKCKIVISQCRCISLDKTVRWSICDKCKPYTFSTGDVSQGNKKSIKG